MSANPFQHTPALLKETLEYLHVKASGTYVDCTLGGGGHTFEVKSIKSKVKIIGFDQDAEAIAAAKERLKEFDGITYVQDNFASLKKHLAKKVDGILFDLGVSSYQIDEPTRGFSVKSDGPLDMRMNKDLQLTAADIINDYSEEELTKIFFEYGEERFSRRIAKAIVRERGTKGLIGTEGLKTTLQLKEIIEKATPSWKKRETVTRIFQALRIAVNDELNVLKSALTDAIELLKPKGRIVVLSYHSLEDRIVKQTFRQSETLKILTKKPVQASDEEVAANPRARSAKLRAAEKI
jgi:16S rRNA (cytosine1402-N4)-methyltransferase